jgi:hypothetical protein
VATAAALVAPAFAIDVTTETQLVNALTSACASGTTDIVLKDDIDLDLTSSVEISEACTFNIESEQSTMHTLTFVNQISSFVIEDSVVAFNMKRVIVDVDSSITSQSLTPFEVSADATFEEVIFGDFPGIANTELFTRADIGSNIDIISPIARTISVNIFESVLSSDSNVSTRVAITTPAATSVPYVHFSRNSFDSFPSPGDFSWNILASSQTVLDFDAATQVDLVGSFDSSLTFYRSNCINGNQSDVDPNDNAPEVSVGGFLNDRVEVLTDTSILLKRCRDCDNGYANMDLLSSSFGESECQRCNAAANGFYHNAPGLDNDLNCPSVASCDISLVSVGYYFSSQGVPWDADPETTCDQSVCTPVPGSYFTAAGDYSATSCPTSACILESNEYFLSDHLTSPPVTQNSCRVGRCSGVARGSVYVQGAAAINDFNGCLTARCEDITNLSPIPTVNYYYNEVSPGSVETQILPQGSYSQNSGSFTITNTAAVDLTTLCPREACTNVGPGEFYSLSTPINTVYTSGTSMPEYDMDECPVTECTRPDALDESAWGKYFSGVGNCATSDCTRFYYSSETFLDGAPLVNGELPASFSLTGTSPLDCLKQTCFDYNSLTRPFGTFYYTTAEYDGSQWVCNTGDCNVDSLAVGDKFQEGPNKGSSGVGVNAADGCLTESCGTLNTVGAYYVKATTLDDICSEGSCASPLPGFFKGQSFPVGAALLDGETSEGCRRCPEPSVGFYVSVSADQLECGETACTNTPAAGQYFSTPSLITQVSTSPSAFAFTDEDGCFVDNCIGTRDGGASTGTYRALARNEYFSGSTNTGRLWPEDKLMFSCAVAECSTSVLTDGQFFAHAAPYADSCSCDDADLLDCSNCIVPANISSQTCGVADCQHCGAAGAFTLDDGDWGVAGYYPSETCVATATLEGNYFDAPDTCTFSACTAPVLSADSVYNVWQDIDAKNVNNCPTILCDYTLLQADQRFNSGCQIVECDAQLDVTQPDLGQEYEPEPTSPNFGKCNVVSCTPPSDFSGKYYDTAGNCASTSLCEHVEGVYDQYFTVVNPGETLPISAKPQQGLASCPTATCQCPISTTMGDAGFICNLAINNLAAPEDIFVSPSYLTDGQRAFGCTVSRCVTPGQGQFRPAPLTANSPVSFTDLAGTCRDCSTNDSSLIGYEFQGSGDNVTGNNCTPQPCTDSLGPGERFDETGGCGTCVCGEDLGCDVGFERAVFGEANFGFDYYVKPPPTGAVERTQCYLAVCNPTQYRTVTTIGTNEDHITHGQTGCRLCDVELSLFDQWLGYARLAAKLDGDYLEYAADGDCSDIVTECSSIRPALSAGQVFTDLNTCNVGTCNNAPEGFYYTGTGFEEYSPSSTTRTTFCPIDSCVDSSGQFGDGRYWSAAGLATASSCPTEACTRACTFDDYDAQGNLLSGSADCRLLADSQNAPNAYTGVADFADGPDSCPTVQCQSLGGLDTGEFWVAASYVAEDVQSGTSLLALYPDAPVSAYPYDNTVNGDSPGCFRGLCSNFNTEVGKYISGPSASGVGNCDTSSCENQLGSGAFYSGKGTQIGIATCPETNCGSIVDVNNIPSGSYLSNASIEACDVGADLSGCADTCEDYFVTTSCVPGPGETFPSTSKPGCDLCTNRGVKDRLFCTADLVPCPGRYYSGASPPPLSVEYDGPFGTRNVDTLGPSNCDVEECPLDLNVVLGIGEYYKFPATPSATLGGANCEAAKAFCTNTDRGKYWTTQGETYGNPASCGLDDCIPVPGSYFVGFGGISNTGCPTLVCDGVVDAPGIYAAGAGTTVNTSCAPGLCDVGFNASGLYFTTGSNPATRDNDNGCAVEDCIPTDIVDPMYSSYAGLQFRTNQVGFYQDNINDLRDFSGFPSDSEIPDSAFNGYTFNACNDFDQCDPLTLAADEYWINTFNTPNVACATAKCVPVDAGYEYVFDGSRTFANSISDTGCTAVQCTNAGPGQYYSNDDDATTVASYTNASKCVVLECKDTLALNNGEYYSSTGGLGCVDGITGNDSTCLGWGINGFCVKSQCSGLAVGGLFTGPGNNGSSAVGDDCPINPDGCNQQSPLVTPMYFSGIGGCAPSFCVNAGLGEFYPNPSTGGNSGVSSSCTAVSACDAPNAGEFFAPDVDNLRAKYEYIGVANVYPAVDSNNQSLGFDIGAFSANDCIYDKCSNYLAPGEFYLGVGTYDVTLDIGVCPIGECDNAAFGQYYADSVPFAVDSLVTKGTICETLTRNCVAAPVGFYHPKAGSCEVLPCEAPQAGFYHISAGMGGDPTSCNVANCAAAPLGWSNGPECVLSKCTGAALNEYFTGADCTGVTACMNAGPGHEYVAGPSYCHTNPCLALDLDPLHAATNDFGLYYADECTKAACDMPPIGFYLAPTPVDACATARCTNASPGFFPSTAGTPLGVCTLLTCPEEPGRGEVWATYLGNGCTIVACPKPLLGFYHDLDNSCNEEECPTAGVMPAIECEVKYLLDAADTALNGLTTEFQLRVDAAEGRLDSLELFSTDAEQRLNAIDLNPGFTPEIGTSYLADLNARLNVVEAPLVDYQNFKDQVDGEIDAIELNIDDIEADVDSLEATQLNIQLGQAGINATQSTQGLDIDDLETTQGLLDGRISDISSDYLSSADKSDLEALINSLQANVGANKKEVDSASSGAGTGTALGVVAFILVIIIGIAFGVFVCLEKRKQVGLFTTESGAGSDGKHPDDVELEPVGSEDLK